MRPPKCKDTICKYNLFVSCKNEWMNDQKGNRLI